MNRIEGSQAVYTIGTWWLWCGFFILIVVALGVDMFVLGGTKSQRVSSQKALTWTLIWFSIAMIFNFCLWQYLLKTVGPLIAKQKALEFFSGYLIEVSLSVDNLFAFILIFTYFQVDIRHQRRVLLYGLLGAFFMRLGMILFGTWLVIKIHWILYVFGLFLLITGFKMLVFEKNQDLANNVLLNTLIRFIPMTQKFEAEHFIVKRNFIWLATPLFLVLVLIELSDLIFALDSIPAIFAITTDPFIIFTSNFFAILGLRALYFCLANLAGRFYLLKYGVALILMFVGAKMLLEPWIKIPIAIVLSIIITILGTTVLLSLLSPGRNKK